jgi:ATP-binding cassette subfamily B protein
MTEVPSHPLLLRHPALIGLSNHLLQRFQAEVQMRRYEIGQPMSFAKQLPSELLLILEGSARLLAREGGRWLTVEKLVPGSWVGLASFLRAGGCEEVSAAEPVLAAAIPDWLAIELLGDSGFYAAACGTVLSAELVMLLQTVQPLGAAGGKGLLEAFAVSKGQASFVSVEGGLGVVGEEDDVWMASCNGRNSKRLIWRGIRHI